MTKTSIPKPRRTDGMSWMWAAGSRVALVLTALVILVMPLTEYFWHFDRFLQGGQDLELTLLSLGTLLCLAMVMLQQGKHNVCLLLSIRKWLSHFLQRDDHATPGSFKGLIAALHAVAVPSPSLCRYTLPLQV